MPYYRYHAKKGPQETIDGVVNSENRDSAIEAITLMGYMPLKVELDSPRARPEATAVTADRGSANIKLRDVVLFSGQLSRLIKTGIPILRALDIIFDETGNKDLKNIIGQVIQDIKSGSVLSESLSRFGRVFPPLYIAIIKAGEESGALPLVLERISEYLKKQEGFSSKIKIALIYPAFMALVGLATLVFMLLFVIPKIKGIYVNVGEALPLPTRILIFISEAFTRHWFWVAIFSVAFFLGLKKILRGKSSFINELKLKIPFYGDFLLKTELARFVASIELSVKNGINALRAIELALPVLSNEILKRELSKAYEQVRQGGSFGGSLKKSKIFPPLMTNMIIVGEESGKLDEMLGEIADYFEKDTDEALKIFTAQFEPAMILIIGLVLGFIVIAVLLPIFQVNLITK